jgi:hypothetical protein
MFEEHHEHRSSVQKAMQSLWNMTKESGAAFTNKPKQLGLVSSVDHFFFQNTSADRTQHWGPRAHLQRSVVDQGDQLRSDQHCDRCFVSGVLSEPSKYGVSPVSLQRPYSMALHKSFEHQSVLLLFLDETASDRDQTLLSEFFRKCSRKREQTMTFGVLAKLKLGY